MRAAFLIASKDLRQRTRDRSAFLIAIVVPFGLAFIFSQILSGIDDGAVTFEYALVDQDGGELALAFTEEVLAQIEEEGLLAVTEASSDEAGRQLARDGEVSATFVIPAGFSEAVTAGEGGQIEVVGNVESPIGTLVATSIAESFASHLTAVQIAVGTAVDQNTPPAEVAGIATAATEAPDPISVVDISATKKELEIKTFFAAAMSVFFLFFTVQFGISSLLDERREGTLSRLQAAPIPRLSIIVGKLLASFVLGVASMGVLVVTTSLLLGAEWGNPVGVAVLVMVGVLAAMAVMGLIATVAKTAEQAGSWQAMVALILGMLGGSFFPVAQAGGLIETLSLLTPHAWFLTGLTELQGGGGVEDIMPSVVAILGFAAVTGVIAFMRQGKLAQS